MQSKNNLQSIHVDHHKNTADSATEVMPIPDFVHITMSQNIGAMCTPTVAKGDYVTVGQKIGDSDAFVSAPIHSGVSGTVVDIKEKKTAGRVSDIVIVIETDKKQEISSDIQIPDPKDFKEFISDVRRSGIVGLGGAAFPTHIKFSPKNLDEVTTLIINGAECEPYITSDCRTMIENTDDVLDGIAVVCKFMQLQKVYIGIEGNKPEAIQKIRQAIADRGMSDAQVVELKSTYPQGSERVMVQEILGKPLNAGVLPAELGVVLSNVTTIAFVGQFFRTGMPLIQKRVTVDGSAVTNPKNVLCPIGTIISDLINFCGGYKEEPKKILMGGPMMGRAIASDDLSVLKNNNAILAFGERDSLVPEETACINCGKCFRACPFRLMPTGFYSAYKQKDVAKLNQLKIMQCMECGSCSYVCPARRPLAAVNKLSKALVKEASSSGK